MRSILERLESALSSAFTAKVLSEGVIDIYDPVQAKQSLFNVRGPVIGWDDYVAGNDYQPPMEYNSNTPLGPADDRGNPHSAKYGGVRPYDPNEVMTILTRQSDDPDTEGLLWRIANKHSVRRSSDSTGRSHDAEEAVSLGALGALKAMAKDQARKGTRFTSYIGFEVENAMTAGVSAGYSNEYRDAQGLLLRVIDALKKAQTAVKGGEPPNDSLAAMGELIASVDPTPGPQNKYGMLAKRLHDFMNYVADEIGSGDLQRIESARVAAEQMKEEIADERDIYQARGPSTNTLITKSKENKPIGMKGMTVTGKSGKEMERSNWLDSELAPGMNLQDMPENQRQAMELRQEINRLENERVDADARDDTKERKRIEKEIKKKEKEIEKLKVGVQKGDKYRPTSGYMFDDPRIKEMITKAVKFAAP
jgi:hypothetical protein